jgi:hypothetical protein
VNVIAGAFLVVEVVVVPAEESAVGGAGFAAVLPGDFVVDFAPAGWFGAAGVGAVAVAGDECFPQRG